jgi:hypothetical protein
VEQPELVHRKAMVGRKRRAVVFVVDERQGHGAYASVSKGDLASYGRHRTAI